MLNDYITVLGIESSCDETAVSVVRLKNKQGKKYRHIIGKSTITTLEPGKELKDFDENNNILRQVKGIVIL